MAHSPLHRRQADVRVQAKGKKSQDCHTGNHHLGFQSHGIPLLRNELSGAANMTAANARPGSAGGNLIAILGAFSSTAPPG
jgi:hypothetical protein